MKGDLTAVVFVYKLFVGKFENKTQISTVVHGGVFTVRFYIFLKLRLRTLLCGCSAAHVGRRVSIQHGLQQKVFLSFGSLLHFCINCVSDV